MPKTRNSGPLGRQKRAAAANNKAVEAVMANRNRQKAKNNGKARRGSGGRKRKQPQQPPAENPPRKDDDTSKKRSRHANVYADDSSVSSAEPAQPLEKPPSCNGDISEVDDNADTDGGNATGNEDNARDDDSERKQDSDDESDDGNNESDDDNEDNEPIPPAMTTQLTNPAPPAPETNTNPPVIPPVNEIVTRPQSSVKTVSSESAGLSEAQEEYVLKEPELREKLKSEIHKHVTQKVFPKFKFPVAREKAEKMCRIAAYLGTVKLPDGVTRKTFGEEMYKEVGKRMKTLRHNTHSSAKWKFQKDWEEGKVPDNFLDVLLDHYRDYLDANGNLIPEREKNFNAFVYFIDRILPSVNFTLNEYGNVTKKLKRLSSCFTVSDEAFALANVENYYLRWSRKMEAKESKKLADLRRRVGTAHNDTPSISEMPAHEQPSEWFEAKWTGSKEGKNCSGWKKEGIARFNEHARNIEKLRAAVCTGEQLEEHVKNYWNGRIQEGKKKMKQHIVQAYEEDDLDVGEFAAI